ncbi:MAG: serine acetyltransferase [Flavobacteriales bacterium]|nr:serine acetyltransferase [Flavobacteriales bacterium]
MSPIDKSKTIAEVIKKLSQPNEYINTINEPLPSIDCLREIVSLVRGMVFPGYFDSCNTQNGSLEQNMEKLYPLLVHQIHSGMFFAKNILKKNASDIANDFIARIPEIKRLLSTDVKEVYDGDPAATSYGEVIFCYPALVALLHYRIAHELHILGVPVLPRIITELAHSASGIDIHPGATIGEYFSIDHGTGVVIGETCIIGHHVRLYQGVTLGAKSFTLDERGLPMNIPRHPIIEDNVIVYSNATILGRVTIGHDSIIGANVWITKDIPAFSKVLNSKSAI